MSWLALIQVRSLEHIDESIAGSSVHRASIERGELEAATHRYALIVIDLICEPASWIALYKVVLGKQE